MRDPLSQAAELRSDPSRRAPDEVAGVASGSTLDALDLRKTTDPLERASDQLAAAREALAQVRHVLDGQE